MPASVAPSTSEPDAPQEGPTDAGDQLGETREAPTSAVGRSEASLSPSSINVPSPARRSPPPAPPSPLIPSIGVAAPERSPEEPVGEVLVPKQLPEEPVGEVLAPEQLERSPVVSEAAPESSAREPTKGLT